MYVSAVIHASYSNRLITRSLSLTALSILAWDRMRIVPLTRQAYSRTFQALQKGSLLARQRREQHKALMLHFSFCE